MLKLAFHQHRISLPTYLDWGTFNNGESWKIRYLLLSRMEYLNTKCILYNVCMNMVMTIQLVFELRLRLASPPASQFLTDWNSLLCQVRWGYWKAERQEAHWQTDTKFLNQMKYWECWDTAGVDRIVSKCPTHHISSGARVIVISSSTNHYNRELKRERKRDMYYRRNGKIQIWVLCSPE